MCRRLRGLSRVVVGVIVLAGASASAGAQTTIIDAGLFVIARDGQRVGTESFSIARVTTGNTTQLRATAVHREGDRATIDTLVTDTTGSPSYYACVSTRGAAQDIKLVGSRSGNRLLLTSRNAAGDASTKELLVSDGLMLLDPGIFSQFYFLFAPHPGGQPPTLVAPLTWQRTPGTVLGGAPGSAADSKVPTTHYTFGEMDIWVSHDQLIVKIEIPGQHLVVTREQPPR